MNPVTLLKMIQRVLISVTMRRSEVLYYLITADFSRPICDVLPFDHYVVTTLAYFLFSKHSKVFTTTGPCC